MNINYLKDNNVYKNEFLEFLYLNLVENYQAVGEYEISDESVGALFTIKKTNEDYMNKIKNNELKISGIDKYDNLIIDKNEITDRPKDEGSKD